MLQSITAKSPKNYEMEKLQMKKILALLLAIVMVIGLAACGGDQTTEPTKKPTSTNNNVSEAGRLPLTTTNEKLVIGVCQNSMVTSYDDNYVTKILEEKTGVDIEFMFFAGGQGDARMLPTQQ